MGRGGGGGGGFSGGGHSGGGSFGGSSRSFSGGSRSYSGSHHSSGGYRPSASYRPSGGYRPSGSYHSGSSGNSWILPYMVGRASANNGGSGNYNRNNDYNNINGGNGGGGGSSNGGYFSSGSGCLKTFLIIMIVFFAIGFFSMLITNDPNATGRTPLSGTSSLSPSIEDHVGILAEDKSYLSDRLKTFHNDTGVVPYVYVCEFDDITNGTEARALYNELFSDGSHLLLIYRANTFSNDDDAYLYYIGEAAETVMDRDACETFENNLVKYYNDMSLSYSEFLGKAFYDTAEDIMAVPGDNTAGAIVLGVMMLLSGLCLFLLVRKEKQIEKAAKDAEILNAPLENLADLEVEDLKKKYSSGSYESVKKDSSTVSDLKDQYDK